MGYEVMEEDEDPSTGSTYTRVKLNGLNADTMYAVVAVSATGVASEPSRIRSALAEDESRIITIGATSCLGSANHPWENLQVAANQSLDIMLLLGDTIYADANVG